MISFSKFSKSFICQSLIFKSEKVDTIVINKSQKMRPPLKYKDGNNFSDIAEADVESQEYAFDLLNPNAF
jgi:hypothetical protein